MLVYIIVGILLFGLLIAVHEGGHFLTAKLLGVQVNEFAIGMGPALFSRKKGETLYSLRAFPMGGYCAMEGEDEETGNPRAFSSKSLWRKIIILAAGSVMNFVAGFVLVAILFAVSGSYTVPVIRRLPLCRRGGAAARGPHFVGQRAQGVHLFRSDRPAQRRGGRRDDGPGGGT